MLVDADQVVRPVIGRNVYIAPTAYVGGDVELGDECSVWHHVMIRGDVSRIRIGRRVNIQDGTIVHTETGVDLDIADDVGIGHRAVVHCRSIGTRSLIGIGAIVLDRCEIGSGCIIAAGAVVPPRTKVPDNSVVMGLPGKVVRETTQAEREYISEVIRRYIVLARKHAMGQYPCAGLLEAFVRISSEPSPG